jgi:hypothetical protein
VVIGLIGVLEVAQHLVPSRHGRLQHGFVKAAGALLGLAAAMFSGRRRLFLSGAYQNGDETVRSEEER